MISHSFGVYISVGSFQRSSSSHCSHKNAADQLFQMEKFRSPFNHRSLFIAPANPERLGRESPQLIRRKQALHAVSRHTSDVDRLLDRFNYSNRQTGQVGRGISPSDALNTPPEIFQYQAGPPQSLKTP